MIVYAIKRFLQFVECLVLDIRLEAIAIVHSVKLIQKCSCIWSVKVICMKLKLYTRVTYSTF